MTDAAFAYHEDVATRSTVKKSAAHKKNGSAVSKLGNKPMSWQEIQSKHGKEETFPSTDCLISYSDFIRYAPDLKVEYLNKMMDKYDINIQHISRYLFNKGDDGLRSYLRNNKLLNLCNYKKARSKSGLLQFQADIEEWKRREKAAKEIDEAETQRKRNIIENALFINREEFEAFTTDEQVSYINSVINRYGVSLAAIERELFKYKCTVLRGRLESAGVLGQIKRGKPGSGMKKETEAFKEAIKEWRGEAVMEEIVQETVPEEPETKTEPVEPVTPKLHKNDISSISISIVDDVKKTDTFDVIENPVTENEFHGSTVYSSTYRSKGVNSNELEGLKLLFADKMVEVSICVRVI